MVSQSTIVLLFVIFGFLIYITERGELGQYFALVYGGGTPAPAPPGSQGGPGGGSATPPPANTQTSSSGVDTAVKVAEGAAEVGAVFLA